MTTRLRARFDGKALVPLDPVDLPTDEVLDLEVRAPGELRPGSPQAILKAIQSLPKLSAEDIADLERSIEEAKLPVRHEGIFDDEQS